MKRLQRGESYIIVAILLVASLFRFCNFDTHQLNSYSNNAVIGVLSVFGLYLLARELFDWRMGAVSSFFLAISFWHVNFSRSEFQAVLVPFVLTFVFYFLWQGLRRSSLRNFFWAGVFSGLGFYASTEYYITPLIWVIVFINYWLFLKKDFSHPDYEQARNRLLGGFSMLVLVTFFIALPLGFRTLKNPETFKINGPESVFNQEKPLESLGISIAKTLGMFTFDGDKNPNHNIPNEPMLGWPLGILFLIGFLRELYHWLARKHGHLSPVHTLMFAWFFVTLWPSFLSVDAPNAIRAVGVLPIVMIFSARGFLWIFRVLEEWEIAHRPWEINNHAKFIAPVVSALALLCALGFYEYHRYFNVWMLIK